MAKQIETKPTLKLCGEDGNAFAILGRAKMAAKEAGWTNEQWDKIMDEATSDDYNHLLMVIMEHFDTY